MVKPTEESNSLAKDFGFNHLTASKIWNKYKTNDVVKKSKLYCHGKYYLKYVLSNVYVSNPNKITFPKLNMFLPIKTAPSTVINHNLKRLARIYLGLYRKIWRIFDSILILNLCTYIKNQLKTVTGNSRIFLYVKRILLIWPCLR